MSHVRFSSDEPPFHQLMDYVFSNYASLDDIPCDRYCDDCRKFCPDCHRERYWKPNQPRYDCPNIKRVYLQRYLACHVAQTRDVLRRTVLYELSQKTSVSATSVGGGPGIECLALAEVLDENGVGRLRFVNYDSEPTWKPLFDDLAEHFDIILNTTKLIPRFISRDFTDDGANRLYDIVFLPWVISEVGETEVSVFISNAVDACEAGGFVVVLERPEEYLRQLILDTFSRIAGIAREFDEYDSVEGNCYISFPETIKDEFGPKFDFHSFYYVFRKL